jgi:hypothetical protein
MQFGNCYDFETKKVRHGESLQVKFNYGGNQNLRLPNITIHLGLISNVPSASKT